MKCRLEIDLNRIIANYKKLSDLAPQSKTAAVIKADAYGIGAVEVARALCSAGCQSFFVAHLDEGIECAAALGLSCEIFVLHGIMTYHQAQTAWENNLIPVLNNLYQIKKWEEFVSKMDLQPPCALHINTGLNRYGISEEEMNELLNNQELLDKLNVTLILSHLADAENQDSQYNKMQLEKFHRFVSYFPNAQKSLANSSGIMLEAEYQFDLNRAGAALYGINPVPNKPNPMLNPIRLIAPIIHLQHLPEGTAVGYNMLFTTQRPTTLATVPVGYADGYPRSSAGGCVYIAGEKAPIVARISMDLMTIDVTDVSPKKIFLKQEVEIIGDHCTPDKIASISNTVGYEILTRLGTRYERIYKI